MSWKAWKPIYNNPDMSPSRLLQINSVLYELYKKKSSIEGYIVYKQVVFRGSLINSTYTIKRQLMYIAI